MTRRHKFENLIVLININMYSKLLPKLGQYGKLMLPMSYGKYKTSNVVINTRKPGFCTVFDVSHMGIFETQDKSILENLFLVNMSKFDNKSKLSAIINENGHIIDDLIIGDVDKEKYRLVVNSNTKDYFRKFEQFTEKNKMILAVQGDYSQEILENLFKVDLSNLYFMENLTVSKDSIEISRCGYTGEDGFEIYMDPSVGEDIKEYLVDNALNNDNVMFGGLIERDILRQEAGMCLSGTDFGPEMNIDFKALNLNFMVDLKYRKQNNYSSIYTRVGLTDNRPIRIGPVNDITNTNIGHITSSTKSFNLNKFIAIGYLKKDFIESIFQGELVPRNMPFVKTNYFRPYSS